MGTGSSVQPKHGVLANPRVQYAAVQSKKKKKVKIDGVQLEMEGPRLHTPHVAYVISVRKTNWRPMVLTV